MSELNEDDQLLKKPEHVEVFMPNHIVKNFNELINEPVPLQYPSEKSLHPPTEQNILKDKDQNSQPLFTDKPTTMRPMLPKQLSQDIEAPAVEKKGRSVKKIGSQEDISDSASAPDNRKGKRIQKTTSKQRASLLTRSHQSPIQAEIIRIVDSTWFSIMMSMVTLYALFGDDIRILSVNKDGDVTFYILTVICMSLFFIEISLTFYAKPDYRFNFYFWLDTISTISMILDIGWITDLWFGGDVTKAYSVQQASSASKAARKAGRVIRVIRLVRLVKLYKQAKQQIERERNRRILQEIIRKAQRQAEDEEKERQRQLELQNEAQEEINFHHPNQLQEPQQQPRIDTTSPIKSEQQNSRSHISHQSSIKPKEQQQVVQESKVGAHLSDLVMRRVIVIILSILISIPLLDLTTYQNTISSYDSGLNRISEYNQTYNIRDVLITKYVNFASVNGQWPIFLVYINYNSTCCQYDYTTNATVFPQPRYSQSQYRFSDLQYYTYMPNGTLQIYSAADLIADNQINSILSICQTIFVSIVLAASALIFNKDVSDLVIDPIEAMMKRIETIADNPLEAANIEEQETLLMEELEKNQDLAKLEKKKQEQSMETYILERIIMKIGALLAVGFGEAGAEIIAENIKKGGGVDPMIPGKKIMAVFGFCDIRNFTDATEVLQKDVMLFVNEIAEIVHSTVDTYCGSANKNIGDAFLLVWKFNANDYHPDPFNKKKLILRTDESVKQKCDMAVLGFLKIITGISLSKKLEKYKKHPGLNARMKDYSVKMGFGLHLGWAIEGAIGSTFKIDASYLSPNVNMASRLEAATKQFGSLILISGVLKKELTQLCQDQLRLIDIVTVKGSIEPVEIHTCDLSIKNLQHKITELSDKYDLSHLKPKAQKKQRVLMRYRRNMMKKQIEKGEVIAAAQFKTDHELQIAREPYTQEFYDTWKIGFEHYKNGKWPEAQQVFQKTLTMIPEHKDGPSNTLLEVIHSQGGKAPHDWKGFRELTEK